MLDDLIPDCPIMGAAWVSCLLWSVTEPGVVEAFRADTGCTWTPPKNGLDRMIDGAAGADKAFVRRYAEWFNANVWGAA